jgi:hypothetical protein
MNIQPVIPISLTQDWNVISRTILPIVNQNHIFPGAGSQFGLGDTLQSLFFSPVKPTAGIIWGVGPVFLIPTGTDSLLTAGKFGLGPTGVALKQEGPWTFGMLFNHVWSVAGWESRPYVSNTFLQPFLAYTTKDAWTFTVNTESTYDWRAENWSVPLNFMLAKLTKIVASRFNSKLERVIGQRARAAARTVGAGDSTSSFCFRNDRLKI